MRLEARPDSRAGSPATSATKKIACGLPMLTTLAGPKSGSASERSDTRASSCDRVRQRDFVPGEARRAHVDAVGPSVPAARRRSGPAAVSTANDARAVSRASRSATQRVPLPQAPARLPSLL